MFEVMKEELEVVISGEVEKLLSKDMSYNEAVDYFRGFIRTVSRKHNVSPVQIIDQVLQYQARYATRNDVVVEFLNAYRISEIPRRRKGTSQQIKEASLGKVSLDSSLLNEVVLTQNRARGKTFELMGLALVEYYLRNIENYSGPINISADRTVFESYDAEGKSAKRRYDLYLSDFKIGVEIKSGRISYHGGIKDQIYKDHYLLKKKFVNDVWWFLYYGASQRVISELLKRKIKFIDLGFNDFEET